MPRPKTSAGLGRRPLLPKIPGPQMPRGPRPPHLNKNMEWVDEQKRLNIESIGKNDRFERFRIAYGGDQYDFLIHDFLLFQKHLSQGDFIWRTNISGFPVDYLFPARQMAWQKRSHGENTSVTDIALTSSGLNVVQLWNEDLNRAPQDALLKAWEGR